MKRHVAVPAHQSAHGRSRGRMALPMSDSEDACAVCMEPLTAEHIHTMDACGHRFHSRCIIGWLQRGHLNCPTCRSDAHQPDEEIPHFAVRERAKYLRRTYGRRTSVPPELTRLIANLRRAEAAQRDHVRLSAGLRRQHKDVLQQHRALRSKQWQLQMKIRSCERQLGMYHTYTLPLPNLTVTRYSP